MYMNGHGVIQRTKELTDALWGAVVPAILGSTAVVCGPLLSWGLLIHKFSWESEPSTKHWIAAGIISVVSIVVGGWASLPYYKAERAIRIHTANVKSETAKRGRGWAVS